jgi:hypothetical protein
MFGNDMDSPRKFAKGEGKHKGAITGLAVDGMNRTVISASDDGKVKVCGVIINVLHSLTIRSSGISAPAFCCMKLTGIR